MPKRQSAAGASSSDRPPSLRESQKAYTRERVIESALKVFAERGFAAATMDDISKTANLNRGTVYLHFTDKAAILRAALSRLQADELELYLAGADAATRDDVQAMFRRATDMWRDHLGPVWRHAHDAASVAPEISEWLDRVFEGQVAKIAKLLTDHGVSAGRARSRAFMLTCMWDAYIYRLGVDPTLANTAAVTALADFFETARTP